jgi:hypothetical protein
MEVNGQTALIEVMPAKQPASDIECLGLVDPMDQELTIEGTVVNQSWIEDGTLFKYLQDVTDVVVRQSCRAVGNRLPVLDHHNATDTIQFGLEVHLPELGRLLRVVNLAQLDALALAAGQPPGLEQ